QVQRATALERSTRSFSGNLEHRDARAGVRTEARRGEFLIAGRDDNVLRGAPDAETREQCAVRVDEKSGAAQMSVLVVGFDAANRVADFFDNTTHFARDRFSPGETGFR